MTLTSSPDAPRTRAAQSARSTKLAVIGAGAVGSSVAYAAMLRGSARTIALYDLKTDKVRAEVLDLAHGSPLASGTRIIGGDDISCVAGADVVVITAGAAQQPGQTRLDLAGVNVGILRSLLPQLLEQAPDAVYVLVTNPCDVLTVAAQQIVRAYDPAFPDGRILSSGTVLDTSRLRNLLSWMTGVDARSIHATIVGEHGDSEFGLWSSANIGQVPLADWADENGERPFDLDRLHALEQEVAGAAYEVIRGKGATNLAIGVAAARIVEAILRDERAVLPVSTPLTDYHGVSGVAMSVPSVVGRHGVERTLDVPMDERELAAFARSADALRAVQESLGL
ncbi:L-lactate dehydrogenase [Brachybacterium sp. JHP9]|uniref:L-lactate dehydrogenase n=1 Tax=Brachybacterium equifaecis TaxID=2910770 RepID=A0ABT0QZA0_9MICO|nr:L-lactate dehydrogenase [Brachybacterium equifaecis]MCL6422359.1 L-lactate dehydrogenase [Brachybacterium equifaecis]